MSEAEEKSRKKSLLIFVKNATADRARNVKEHQSIDAKTQLANLHQEETLKKKKSIEEGERTKILKPGDEVLVTTYGQRGTLLRKKRESVASRNRHTKNECVRRRTDACRSSKEPTQRVVHAVRS